MLSLRGVSYRYPGAKVESLHGVDLDLAEGTITGLVGPADAGKSTLCLVAGGLAPRVVGGRLVGQVGIDLEDVAGWPMHRLAEQVVTGMQEPTGQLTLIAESVAEEVAFGPANLGLPRDDVVTRTWTALEQVGAAELAERDPTALSGGQQQLVVLAGLLAMRARHLVLDEPLAHLDATAAGRVLTAVRAAADEGTAVMVAEQRIDELAAVCDTVAVMGAGNILAWGPTDEVLARPSLAPLGIETSQRRIERRLAEAGFDLEAMESGS